MTTKTNEAAHQFSIRPAEAADFKAAESLLASAGLPVAGLRDQFGPQYALAVTADGEAVGLAGFEVHGQYALLRSVAIRPEWRGRGLGRALVADRVAAARGRELAAAYALTTTAASYFPRLGFDLVERAHVPEPVRASSEFSSICPASAAVLYLRLS